MKKVLKKIQQEEHSRCFLCGNGNERGFNLDFEVKDDGSIETSFAPSVIHEGYDHILHGGVISALLDSIMTNCLFAHGVKAVTAELNVRFLTPVKARGLVKLSAEIEKSNGSYHVLKAFLSQDDVMKAKATGKFIAFFKNPVRKNAPEITDCASAP